MDTAKELGEVCPLYVYRSLNCTVRASLDSCRRLRRLPFTRMGKDKEITSLPLPVTAIAQLFSSSSVQRCDQLCFPVYGQLKNCYISGMID